MKFIKIDENLIIEMTGLYISKCSPKEDHHVLNIGNSVIARNFDFQDMAIRDAKFDYFEKMLFPEKRGDAFDCIECENELTLQEIEENNTAGIDRKERYCQTCDYASDPT